MNTFVVWILLLFAGPLVLTRGFRFIWRAVSRYFQKIYRRFHDWLDTWDAVIDDDDENKTDNQEK